MSVRRALWRLTLAVLAASLPFAASAESPKRGTFEFRVASFRPDIDSEPGLVNPATGLPGTPYGDVFGTKRGAFPKLLVSYTLFDWFVQVDAGVGTGWFRAKAKAFNKSAATGGLLTSRSEDNTTFSIIPATLALTVRVDGFAERWSIPIDLYGRAALERYNWLVTGGSGSVSEKGATNGWSIAAGVGLLLDFIDPVLSRELEADTGINHTWLYFEVEKSRVDDFGSKKSWNLSEERLSLAGGLRMVF